MSQENVEVIRRLYETGVTPFDAAPDQIDRIFRDYLDEQFEVRLPPDYPEGEPVFRGREGAAQFRAMLQATWGKWRVEPERFLDAGDCVVVFARILAEGGASGVPIEVETAHVWTVRGGRAASVHAYRDRSDALEAARLAE
jgi:ketosteroid isomerase-like protein